MWIARSEYEELLNSLKCYDETEALLMKRNIESSEQLSSLMATKQLLKEECKLMNEHARDTYDSWVRRTDELANAQDKIVELERELEKTKRSLSAAEKGNIRLNAKLKELQQ